MPDSKQLDILKRLTAHYQKITPANGYEFDLSSGVFRGRQTYDEDDPLDVVSIVESPIGDVPVDVAGENNITRTEVWLLRVQGWTKADRVNPTDRAYQLKAAVELQSSRLISTDSQGSPLYPDEYFLGLHGITGMSIGPGIVAVSTRQEGSSYAFFYLPLGIHMAVRIDDPFVS